MKRGTWRDRLRRAVPVNKGSRRGATGRQLPQITGVFTLAALRSLRRVVKRALAGLRPTPPVGRDERFRTLVLEQINSSPLVDVRGPGREVDAEVEVLQTFGKPTIVSFDVVVVDESGAPEDADGRDGIFASPGQRALAVDLFDRVVQAIWNNPEMAPVGIRGRVFVTRPGEAENAAPEKSLVFDMTELGFQDEIARPQTLFGRYGAPTSDPEWRP